VSYIIDTDILIYFLKGHEKIVKRMSTLPNDMVCTTIINQAELLFGAYNSTREKQNLKIVERFLENFTIFPFCEKAAHYFGRQKTFLKSIGTPIADMDLMIASIALQHKMILVTNNTKHFNKIKELKLDNWV
jgi:tRNA(fMet)-specific endonuclease VapC